MANNEPYSFWNSNLWNRQSPRGKTFIAGNIAALFTVFGMLIGIILVSKADEQSNQSGVANSPAATRCQPSKP